MKLNFFHIDAFAKRFFEGNPAAVCLLEEWLPDEIMQAIAAELNLSETCFLVRKSAGEYRIRWFAPRCEIALCGHATLAASHMLFNEFDENHPVLRFACKSGELRVTKNALGFSMDFPAQTVEPIAIDPNAVEAFGIMPESMYAGEDLVALFDDASQVAIMEPDFGKLAALPYRGICVAAPDHSGKYDFVNRFFAPKAGINEDPVTGSSFTKLAPVFAKKLAKNTFSARQVSPRGGDVQLQLQGDRLLISGTAITVMRSVMILPTH